jgi:hypothetical protein
MISDKGAVFLKSRLIDAALLQPLFHGGGIGAGRDRQTSSNSVTMPGPVADRDLDHPWQGRTYVSGINPQSAFTNIVRRPNLPIA